MAGLPAEFASLEPHLGWALETERERLDRKLASSADEIQIVLRRHDGADR